MYAKSGCYTCRIHHKKCDDKPNTKGNCVRLHLECLGFGTKHPEWLRDNCNILAMQDRLKKFLTAQGTVKGKSWADADIM